MLSVAVPVLFNRIVCDELVVFTRCARKLRLVGERFTLGAPEPVPVPVRLTVCGLPVTLSVTVIVPVRVPAAVGVKVTVIVHVPAGATEAGQLLVWL